MADRHCNAQSPWHRKIVPAFALELSHRSTELSIPTCSGDSVRARQLRQRGCGWRNPEEAANNYPERLKPVASKADCIELSGQRQTSGKPGVPRPFAKVISSA